MRIVGDSVSPSSSKQHVLVFLLHTKPNKVFGIFIVLQLIYHDKFQRFFFILSVRHTVSKLLINFTLITIATYSIYIIF